MAHDHLWAGADLKLSHALFFYSAMSRVLVPDRSHMAGQDVVTGANWQGPLYAYLDAFLVMARSVPAIIEFCFGKDRVIPRAIFDALDPDEQKRRINFSNEFEKLHLPFRQHPLSNQRNISFHRAGYASVEVKITGRFGIDHVGSPIKAVPSAEGRALDTGADPALQIAAAQRALPVEPRWSDFTIDGKPLFDECKSYLDLASELRSQAQEIGQRVHGDKPLTAITLP